MPHAWRACRRPLVLLAAALSGCLRVVPHLAHLGRQGRARPRRLPRCSPPATSRSRATPPPGGLRAAAHRPDLCRRLPARPVRPRGVRRPRRRVVRLPRLLAAVHRFTGADESLAMRTILSWAWFRPERGGLDGTVPGGTAATSSAAVTRPAATSTCRTDQGAAARTAEGRVDGLRPGRLGRRFGEGPVLAEARLARRHHDRARRRERRLPGRPRGPVPHPRLLLEVGQCLARLPGRLRLRLLVVPRGRVGRRQPAFGVLGQDRRREAATGGAGDRRHSLPRRRCCSRDAPARAAPDQTQARRRSCTRPNASPTETITPKPTAAAGRPLVLSAGLRRGAGADQRQAAGPVHADPHRRHLLRRHLRQACCRSTARRCTGWSPPCARAGSRRTPAARSTIAG